MCWLVWKWLFNVINNDFHVLISVLHTTSCILLFCDTWFYTLLCMYMKLCTSQAHYLVLYLFFLFYFKEIAIIEWKYSCLSILSQVYCSNCQWYVRHTTKFSSIINLPSRTGQCGDFSRLSNIFTSTQMLNLKTAILKP